MNIKIFALAGAALAALAAQPAKAQSTLLATSSNWNVWHTIADGRALCMMSQGNATWSLSVAVAADEPGFSLRVGKSSWQIPHTTGTIPMDISFDGVKVTSNNWGVPLRDHKSMAFVVGQGSARDFVHWMTENSMVTVTFAGTEPPWTVSLAGTTGAWPAFMNCAKTVNPGVIAQLTPPLATQPFATQPYAAPAPSQPSAAPDITS